MTESTTTPRKKTSTKPVEQQSEPVTNWHVNSGIRVCPDCGEPKTTNDIGRLVCPVRKKDCSFIK
jgi:hypothetical protein